MVTAETTIPVRVMGGHVDVRGVQFGDWSATPFLNWDNSTDENRWRVTHVPSGLAVNERYVGCLDRSDAERVARALHESGVTASTTEPFAEPMETRFVIESVAALALDEDRTP